jgi:phosphoribosylglycinamide formyltransferase 1
VVLSGYAKRVGPLTIVAFDGRMLNVHPAPLPEFGGQGMYGMAVHEAVLSSDRQETAVTIHQVNDRYDDGAIVASYSIPFFGSPFQRLSRKAGSVVTKRRV